MRVDAECGACAGKMDLAKNDFRGEERDVTAEGATVKVLVIPTNEELMIAMDTAEIVKG